MDQNDILGQFLHSWSVFLTCCWSFVIVLLSCIFTCNACTISLLFFEHSCSFSSADNFFFHSNFLSCFTVSFFPGLAFCYYPFLWNFDHSFLTDILFHFLIDLYWEFCLISRFRSYIIHLGICFWEKNSHWKSISARKRRSKFYKKE